MSNTSIAKAMPVDRTTAAPRVKLSLWSFGVIVKHAGLFELLRLSSQMCFAMPLQLSRL